MQLSKHFRLEEFEKSQTAQRLGIKNKAGSGEIKNLTDVCYGVLEKVRVKYDKPVIVTSGYRSPELCEAIGSKSTSQHTKGEAVDFEVIGVANIQVAYFIEANCDFDQLILEYYCPDDDQKGWVHCSFVEGSNRKQVLTFDGKKYTNGLPEMKWSGGKVVE
jgi:hypothetical protein|tara:strand:+ start:37 stop:519 length:483 start_codon:yes stop_codon:yes gene_type:complete